jgi:hypothetical protein
MNGHFYNNDYLRRQRSLPNSTAVLVLGILSLVVCLLCGIVALILAKQDLRLYNDHPEDYTETSLAHLKAGRICAIISVIFLSIAVFFFIVIISFNLSR